MSNYFNTYVFIEWILEETFPNNVKQFNNFNTYSEWKYDWNFRDLILNS